MSRTEIKVAEAVTVLDGGRTLIAKLRTGNGMMIPLAFSYSVAKGLVATLASALALAAARSTDRDTISFFTPGKVTVSAVPSETNSVFLGFDMDGTELRMRLDAETAQALASTVNETLARLRSHRKTSH